MAGRAVVLLAALLPCGALDVHAVVPERLPSSTAPPAPALLRTPDLCSSCPSSAVLEDFIAAVKPEVKDANGNVVGTCAGGTECLSRKGADGKTVCDQMKALYAAGRQALAPFRRLLLELGEVSGAANLAGTPAGTAEIDAAAASGRKPLLSDMGPFKTTDRAAEKCCVKYQFDCSKVSDLVRGTIAFETPRGVIDGFNKFIQYAKAHSEEWQIVGFKNRFTCSEDPDPNAGSSAAVQKQPSAHKQCDPSDPRTGELHCVCGTSDRYRDILINIKIGEHTTELQIHLKPMLETKNGEAHTLYDQIRGPREALQAGCKERCSDSQPKMSPAAVAPAASIQSLVRPTVGTPTSTPPESAFIEAAKLSRGAAIAAWRQWKRKLSTALEGTANVGTSNPEITPAMLHLKEQLVMFMEKRAKQIKQAIQDGLTSGASPVQQELAGEMIAATSKAQKLRTAKEMMRNLDAKHKQLWASKVNELKRQLRDQKLKELQDQRALEPPKPTQPQPTPKTRCITDERWQGVSDAEKVSRDLYDLAYEAAFVELTTEVAKQQKEEIRMLNVRELIADELELIADSDGETEWMAGGHQEAESLLQSTMPDEWGYDNTWQACNRALDSQGGLDPCKCRQSWAWLLTCPAKDTTPTCTSHDFPCKNNPNCPHDTGRCAATIFDPLKQKLHDGVSECPRSPTA